MKVRSLPFIIVFILIALLAESAVASVGGNASFRYTKSNSKTSAGSSSYTSFNETYMLTVTKSLTKTIDAMLNVFWVKNTADAGNGGKSKSSSMYPTLVVNFRPPSLYNLSMGHTRVDTDPSEGIRLTTTSTFASFSTPKFKFIQPVSLSYNLVEQYDGEKVRKIDHESETWGVGTGYGFNVLGGGLSLGYSYGTTKDTDNISGSYTQSSSQGIGGGYSRNLGKKYSMSLSASVGHSETTMGSTSPTLFELPVTLQTGLSCSACAGALSLEPALIDNNTAVQAGTINVQNANWHTGFGLSLPTSIFKLHLYVTTTPAEELNIQSIYVFNWQVYSSNDNVVWTPTALSSVTYDSVNNRFEFTITPVSALYFKVVNLSGQGVNILVTEIKAFKNILSVADTKHAYSADSRSFGFSFSGSPTEKSSFGYSLSYGESESSGDPVVRYGLSHGLTGGYVFHPQYLNMQAAISWSESGTDKEKAAAESKNYVLTAASQPLDTIRLGTNFSRAESYSYGAKTSVSDSIGLGAGLNLYRGISLSLSANTSTSKSFASNAESKSTGFSDDWTFVPWQAVNITVRHTMSSSEYSDSTGSAKSSSDSLSSYVTYRPIPEWTFSAEFNIEPTTSQSYSLSLIVTSNVRANLNASFSDNNKTYSGALTMSLLPRVGLWLNYSRSDYGSGQSDYVSSTLQIAI